MLLPELIVVLAGLVIGSFLNVCIHRIPRGESVVSPRSRCPRCGHAIAFWENIPVVSFLLLGGRCRECRASISWIYPLVETLTAVGFLLLYVHFGFNPPFFVNAVLFCILICLIFIDLFERILPDVLTLGGTVIGLLAAGLQSGQVLGGRWTFQFDNPLLANYLNSTLGILVGGGILWAVAVLYLKIRKREGMGFGDIKMMMMVGAFLGWKLAWFTILTGSVLGVLIGGGYMYFRRKGRQYELPFGSFLGLGAIIATLYGHRIISWYLSLT